MAPLLFGLGVGIGDRSFAQGVRTDLGFEAYEWEREQAEFTVYVHSETQRRRAEASVERLRQHGPHANINDDYSEVSNLVNISRGLIETAAAWPDRLAPEHAALRERAREFSLPPTHDFGDGNREPPQHV